MIDKEIKAKNFNQGEKRLRLPYPPENLNINAQREIQALGDITSEVLSTHLGIPLDIFDIFRDFIYHLRSLDKKLREHQDYSKKFKELVEPQMKTLSEMVGEYLHSSEWKVRISRIFFFSIEIQHRTSDLIISFGESGWKIDSADLEISWNMFPMDVDDTLNKRKHDTYVLLHQREVDQNISIPVVKIQSEATVSGDGPLSYYHTDKSRRLIKPTTIELISPQLLTTQAVYNNEGKLTFIRVVFAIPGKERSIRNDVAVIYDFKNDEPKNGVIPSLVQRMISQEIIDLPIYPEIEIEGDFLRIKYLNQQDSFPIVTSSPTEVAQKIQDLISEKFPPKEELLQLSS